MLNDKPETNPHELPPPMPEDRIEGTFTSPSEDFSDSEQGDITVPSPEYPNEKDQNTKKGFSKKSILIGAGAAAGIAGIATSAAIFFSGAEQEEEPYNPYPNTEATMDEEATGEIDEGEDLGVHESNENSDEYEDSENSGVHEQEELADGLEMDRIEPVLMTAETPEKLVEQFKQNYDCILDAPSMSNREECIRFIKGDRDGGEMERNLLNIASYAERRKSQNPNWELSMQWEIVDSLHPLGETFPSSVFETVFIIRTTVSESGLDDETDYARVRFRYLPYTEITEDLTVDGDVHQGYAWFLQGSNLVDPGTTTELG